jgi:vancomycin resistance protein YoaR
MFRSGKRNGGFFDRFRGETGRTRTVVLFAALGLVVAAGACIAAIFFLGPSGPGSEGILNGDKFYNGVFVDGIPVGGLTKSAAKEQVEAKQRTYADMTAVTVVMGSQSWQFKLSGTTHSYDTDAVLNEAWKQGRQGTDQERLAFIQKLPDNPVKLITTVTADPSPLEAQVRALAAPYYIAPVDAAFTGYDPTKPEGQRLSFSPDKPGQQVDADVLWVAVRKAFDERTYGTVQMKLVPVQANLTLSELQSNMQLVTRFKSYLKDHSKPRYTNISLASAAISGHFILPGQTFSFNGTTGERTAEKGYQEAHVINGGVVDNGLAGGTCQVSGTLFNALARADLQIVERDAHSLKSAYLPLGQDATVDYGHYDLRFKNQKNTPVLMVMYLGTGDNKNYLFAEVYGVPLEGGQAIGLVSEITETVPAPGTTSYVPSSAVKRGTTETVKPHIGRKVTTYKVCYKNKVEVNRTVLYKDYYREAGTIVCYNPADGLPTPTPKPTPTPSATPGHTATHTPAPTIAEPTGVE